MRIKHLLTAGSAALCMLPTLWAAPPNDQQVFQETVKNVDLGGSFLYYLNHRELNAMLDKAPDFISNAAGKIIPRTDCYEACRIILKTLNLQAIQGSAISIAHPQPDQTVVKSACYFGGDINANGIHNWLGRGNNISCNFARLPNDTRVFTHCEINLGSAAAQLEKDLRSSSSAFLRSLPDKLNREAGISITRLAATFNGRVLLLLRGSSTSNISALIYVPDANGSLTELLKQKLPAPDERGIVKLPQLATKEFPHFAPFLMYRQGGVLFATNDAPVQASGAFAKYAAKVPAKANYYSLVDLDAATIAEIQRAAAGTKDATPLFSLLKPFTIVGSTYTSGNAMVSVVFFNCNLGKNLLELPEKIADAVLKFNQMQK